MNYLIQRFEKLILSMTHWYQCSYFYKCRNLFNNDFAYEESQYLYHRVFSFSFSVILKTTTYQVISHYKYDVGGVGGGSDNSKTDNP